MTTATASFPTVTLPTATRRAHREEARIRTEGEHGLLHYLGVGLSSGLLVLLLAVAVAVVALPALVGGSAMTVLTQSMEPTLPPGTLVVVKPTPADEIAIGDVVTYQIRSGEAAVVSHRVISKTYTDGALTFITQGDNNTEPDADPVRAVQIRGTIWYSFPLLGWVNSLLTGANRTLVLAISAGGLFLYAVFEVVQAARERARRRAADAAEAAGEATSPR